jgi:AraC-like DNA-binding protein
MNKWYELYFGKTHSRYYSPTPALNPYIKKYLIYENREDQPMGIPFRALPNGYTELYLHLKGSGIRFLRKNECHQHAHFVAGIFEMGYPLKLDIDKEGRIFKGVCVTFHPTGVPRLLGIHVGVLTNRILDFSSLAGTQSQLLLEHLEMASSDQEIIHHLNTFFMTRLNQGVTTTSGEIHQILELFSRTIGQSSIEELARHTNHSYKSIYRLFDKHLGLCPKMYIKILRFNKACSLLHLHPGIGWTELVHRCGYYDQSHFIREFRAIMKESPCHFLKTSGGNFYLNRAFCFK